MMAYLAKLALLLPLLALLIWGSLKLASRLQRQLGRRAQGAERRIRLVETCFLGPGLRLAVIEFRGREILLGCSRHALVRLAEAPPGAKVAQAEAPAA